MIDIKSGKYLEVRRLASAMEQLSIVGPGISVTPMQMQAIRDRLQISLETLHLHQEPWLLNANLAREARFLI